MINVTKSYLPPMEEYIEKLQRVWESNHLTNHGPLSRELEQSLKDYLGVKHLFLVSNGTIAIQIAIKALGLTKEVITTPFSYVATTSSVVWEKCRPVFADIDSETLCIDPDKIEALITPETEAILAVHVYGNACDTKKIDTIAKKHNLKVIYDAAHAFGVEQNGRSILNEGDVSTLSFHATKIFHTIEGGAIITNDDEIAHKLSYHRNFGHNSPETFHGLGINGKNSEFHAAMGLCVLPKMDEFIADRKRVSELYDRLLAPLPVKRPKIASAVYNYAYYPVMFKTEKDLLEVVDCLNKQEIFPRRYFYPSLNTLHYLETKQKAPVSEDISTRILCLPIYPGLPEEDVRIICEIISEALLVKV